MRRTTTRAGRRAAFGVLLLTVLGCGACDTRTNAPTSQPGAVAPTESEAPRGAIIGTLASRPRESTPPGKSPAATTSCVLRATLAEVGQSVREGHPNVARFLRTTLADPGLATHDDAICAECLELVTDVVQRLMEGGDQEAFRSALAVLRRLGGRERLFQLWRVDLADDPRADILFALLARDARPGVESLPCDCMGPGVVVGGDRLSAAEAQRIVEWFDAFRRVEGEEGGNSSTRSALGMALGLSGLDVPRASRVEPDDFPSLGPIIHPSDYAYGLIARETPPVAVRDRLEAWWRLERRYDARDMPIFWAGRVLHRWGWLDVDAQLEEMARGTLPDMEVYLRASVLAGVGSDGRCAGDRWEEAILAATRGLARRDLERPGGEPRPRFQDPAAGRLLAGVAVLGLTGRTGVSAPTRIAVADIALTALEGITGDPLKVGWLLPVHMRDGPPFFPELIERAHRFRLPEGVLWWLAEAVALNTPEPSDRAGQMKDLLAAAAWLPEARRLEAIRWIEEVWRRPAGER
jgi:hypothetical protein